MGNLVIVAIPEEQDRVWKISSEKIPHLTLLFLGDADSNPNVQQIMEFVQHAVDVSEHGQFYLDVDRRDVLGSDEADVVFFSKRSWNLKWIKQFRSQLLQNDAIRTAYDSNEQFPEWQPHLTLGYPTAPANELDGAFDHPIYSVCFDRIAVWTGDFDGPEFRLEWPDRELSDDLAVAYSGTGKSAIDELLHVGVKGMRWGVRKVDVASGAKSVAKGAGKAAKGAAKLADDVLFESGTTHESIRQDIASTAHSNLKEHDLPAIKTKHPVGGKFGNRLKKPLSPEAKAYRKDVKSAYLKQLEAAANEHTNFQGNRRYTLKENGQPNTSQYFWDVSTEGTPAKHAASAPFRVRPIFDEEGYIVDFEYVPNEMAQTESFVDDYLVHYGVKGMHWGSRKSSEVTPTSVEVKSTPHNSKTTKVEVKGGGGHDAHPDAIKVAEARQKLRKSGSAALSNKELKDVANRLQLESNVARLEGERKSGSTFVGKLLRKHGSQQLDRGINRAAGQVTDDVATRAGQAATKKIFKAGVAAAL